MNSSARAVPNAPIVLHVVEAYGGGVMNVIHDYIAATPEYNHFVLGSVRPEHDTGSDVGVDASHLLILPRKPLAAIRRIGAVARSLRPAIVHAHSSKAGAFVRLSRAVSTDSIYYTPHCFAFERLDVRALTRLGYRLIERALVRRTRHFVAVSGRELELARGLRGDADGTYVPNVASVPALTRELRASPTRTVATIGRVSMQKDPQFFIDTVRAASELGSAAGIKWVWLGDGPDRLVGPLRAAGVEVTGWLPREEVISRLNSAQVYLHTASWEGSPLSILEAATLGLPMVIRKTPATESLELADLIETPDDAARAVGRAVNAGRHQMPHQDLLERHTTRAQRATLRAAYQIAAPISDDVISARRTRDIAAAESTDFNTASRAAS